MIGVTESPGPLDACQRLLQLALRQAQALEAEEFETYQALAGERDQLLPALARPFPPHLRAPALAILNRVADLDRENVALVRRLIFETGQLLQQIRQGQGALNGYARPGAHLAAPTSCLDTAR